MAECVLCKHKVEGSNPSISKYMICLMVIWFISIQILYLLQVRILYYLMICLQKPIYRCEVWCLSTNLASLKLVHSLLPFFINYTGLSTRIKRFTLLRSPLGNKTKRMAPCLPCVMQIKWDCTTVSNELCLHSSL